PSLLRRGNEYREFWFPPAWNPSAPNALWSPEGSLGTCRAGKLRAMTRKGDMDTLVGKRPPHSGASGKPPGKSSATHKARIPRNLTPGFGPVTNEKLPDRWLELLDEIDGNEGKKS